MTQFRELKTEEGEELLRKLQETLPEDEFDTCDEELLPEDCEERCLIRFAAEKDGEVIGMADLFAMEEHRSCSRVYLLRDPQDDRELNDVFSDFTYYVASNQLLKRLRAEYDEQYGSVA